MVTASSSSISHRVPMTWGNPASWNAVVRWMASSISPAVLVSAVSQADR